jgi:hypothetical protein
MKQLLLLFFICQAAAAQQDSTKKQRFVDEHQYFFMTKEPSKWVIKAYFNELRSGYSYCENCRASRFTTEGPNVTLAFERKISQANSIEIAAQTRNFLTIQAELRHYINMKERIKQGLAANNTSGSYFSIAAKQSVLPYSKIYQSNFDNIKPEFPTWIDAPLEGPSFFQLNWGNQQWMANRTILDFSINAGLLRTRSYKENTSQLVKEVRNYTGISPFIASTLRYGMWFNDIKTKATTDKCEVLRCFDEEHSLLKINLSELFYLSKNSQQFKGNIAFEQKLGSSPFSINFDASTFSFYSKRVYSTPSVQNLRADGAKSVFNQIDSKGTINSLMLQSRYYLWQKNRVASGNGVDNLTGLYAAAFVGFSQNKTQGGGFDRETSIIKTYNKNTKSYRLGASVGIQSRLSKRGFLDAGLMMGVTPRSAIFEQIYSDTKGLQVEPYLKIGYAIGR